MVDRISQKHRSWNMSRIRGRDTAPELRVRSLLHRLGFRFRLHPQTLPGKPDIVLAKHRTIVLVHGCFWHRHAGCRYAYRPKSNVVFWNRKFSQNQARDEQLVKELRSLGWRTIVVWECQTHRPAALKDRLRRLLMRHSVRPKRSPKGTSL
jgi:DNA mismatch endonuclease (patch repair protein)